MGANVAQDKCTRYVGKGVQGGCVGAYGAKLLIHCLCHHAGGVATHITNPTPPYCAAICALAVQVQRLFENMLACGVQA